MPCSLRCECLVFQFKRTKPFFSKGSGTASLNRLGQETSYSWLTDRHVERAGTLGSPATDFASDANFSDIRVRSQLEDLVYSLSLHTSPDFQRIDVDSAVGFAKDDAIWALFEVGEELVG